MKNYNTENEARAYKLIMGSIAPESTIQVTDEHVYIHSSTLSAQEIESLLANPNRFKNAVRKYVFTPANKEAGLDSGVGLQNGAITHTLSRRSKTPELPHDFFKALFGPEILRELGLLYISPDKLTEIDGNLIYSIENYEITGSIWNERIRMLKNILKGAGVSSLEQVFSSGTPLQLSGGQLSSSDIAKNFDDVIGIKVDDRATDNNSKRVFFYLNMRYLINLIFAPEVIEVEDKGLKVIRIDKGQFSDYLGQVFGDIVVPNQDYQDKQNSADTFVTPVIIPVSISNSLNKQNVYILVIDTSGSLEPFAEQYKQQLVNIVDRLVRVIKDSAGEYVNPKDLIRLVFFNDRSSYVDFNVTTALNNVEDLKKCIMSAQIHGNTLLDGTIALQIDELPKLCSEETCNVNMLIFTDGMDNRSSNEAKQSLVHHGDRFREQKTGLIPKFQIFRVGESDVSKIEAISRGIDAQIYDIADVGGLGRVFEQISDLNLHRDFVKFVQGLHETTISLYEKRLTIGPNLDVSQQVQIKGKSYAISQTAPEATAEVEVLVHPSSTMSWLWSQCTTKNVGVAGVAAAAVALDIATTELIPTVYRRMFCSPNQ